MFKHHDTLRLFVELARHRSFSDAAHALNMTKGAVSYQVKVLEADLGVSLFDRAPRGVTLTPSGRELLVLAGSRYESIEHDLAKLKNTVSGSLTVGMSSYFASRWLSPRLMNFMLEFPEIQLRIQPIINMFDLKHQGVDLAIRWGNGSWSDVEITQLLQMPAWPVGNQKAADRVRDVGLQQAFADFTLLRDHDDSNAWTDWFDAAGLQHQNRKDALIIPDPNVRVQAVIDGQGVALNDRLIAQELKANKLVRLSDVELGDYGYYLARPSGQGQPNHVEAFISWIQSEISG